MALAIALFLSACGGSVIPPPTSAGYTPASPRPAQRPVMQGPSLGVIGVDARALVRLLGEPRLDIRDPASRKLQFTDGRCVLDTYLYAPGARREPVVTFAEARRADGSEMDWGACATQLKGR